MEGGVAECIRHASRFFEVLEVKTSGETAKAMLGLPLCDNPETCIVALYRDLASRKCYPAIRREAGGIALYIVNTGSKGLGALPAAGLAAATLVTVYISGLALSGGEGFSWSPLSYLVGLLAPLLIHEAGHWFVMKLYNVPRSFPYLLPAPPLQLGFIGTFGAVINLRWFPPTPDSLSAIAVAGPLAGFIAAIPLTIVGLANSMFISPEAVPAEELQTLPVAPLILLLLEPLAGVPEGYVVVLSPLAFAGYIVFLVTFLNLIPIGTLDGGHIVRSVIGERGFNAVSMGVVAVSIVASIVIPPLALFALIALGIYILTGGRHPGASMLEGRAGPVAAASVVVYSLLLGLTFPIPLV